MLLLVNLGSLEVKFSLLTSNNLSYKHTKGAFWPLKAVFDFNLFVLGHFSGIYSPCSEVDCSARPA